MDTANKIRVGSLSPRLNGHPKFKFCYIMRGYPGSGKSTVAKQLAGTNGKILYFENKLSQSPPDIKKTESKEEKVGNYQMEDNSYNEFCQEIANGTEILIVDNNSLCESEYMKLVKKA